MYMLYMNSCYALSFCFRLLGGNQLEKIPSRAFFVKFSTYDPVVRTLWVFWIQLVMTAFEQGMVKPAGNSFRDFSNSYTLKDEYYNNGIIQIPRLS